MTVQRFLLCFRVPGPPRSASKQEKRGLDLFVFFSVGRYAPKQFRFDFCVIRGVLFDPGDGPKETK